MKIFKHILLFAFVIITINFATTAIMAQIIVDDPPRNGHVAGNSPNIDGTFSSFSELYHSGTTTEGYSIIINTNIGTSQLYYNVYGAAIEYAGSELVSANRNSVTVNLGNMSSVYGGYAFNSVGEASALDNSVTVNSGYIQNEVFAGYAVSNGQTTALASRNSLTFNSGQAIFLASGLAYIPNGSATASENTLTINADTIDSVSGGYAYGGTSATALENTLTINADA
ncbi:MAG: hypothetical protein LBJ61_01515 [Deltaproteobacteria bacterium]|jgi:hypothetical protein|nr:hypothetical protein [Deltaproteobacteria bacterium]